MFTIEKLQHILQTNTDKKKFVVAYSGGLDSHVLLHAMSQCVDVSLIAVHVNHQLNLKADQWAAHCQAVCDALGVSLRIEKISIDLTRGESLEEKAREARYAVFKKFIDKDSVLLTAHHLDDQAETFLLQALRGSGLKGLSAMPAKKALGESVHVRPLLSFARADLQQYAVDHQLAWIDDESNADTRFDRNFLRHAIFPLLKKRFPAVMQNFSRSARWVAEAEMVIEADIENHFLTLVDWHGDLPHKLDFKKLQRFSLKQQRLLLRHWFHKNHLEYPTEKQLLQIEKDVLQSRADANPVFYLDEMSIRRFQHYLYLVPRSKSSLALPKNARSRRPGDRVKLPGHKASKSLKNYFQEQGVPPWERDDVPFIEMPDGYLNLL